MRLRSSRNVTHPILTKSPPLPPKRKSRRILRAAVITAACIVILCGAASAFGFDILQAFADWTAETFGFVTPGQEEAEAPQEVFFLNLRLAVAEGSRFAPRSKLGVQKATN